MKSASAAVPERPGSCRPSLVEENPVRGIRRQLDDRGSSRRGARIGVLLCGHFAAGSVHSECPSRAMRTARRLRCRRAASRRIIQVRSLVWAQDLDRPQAQQQSEPLAPPEDPAPRQSRMARHHVPPSFPFLYKPSVLAKNSHILHCPRVPFDQHPAWSLSDSTLPCRPLTEWNRQNFIPLLTSSLRFRSSHTDGCGRVRRLPGTNDKYSNSMNALKSESGAGIAVSGLGPDRNGQTAVGGVTACRAPAVDGKRHDDCQPAPSVAGCEDLVTTFRKGTVDGTARQRCEAAARSVSEALIGTCRTAHGPPHWLSRLVRAAHATEQVDHGPTIRKATVLDEALARLFWMAVAGACHTAVGHQCLKSACPTSASVRRQAIPISRHLSRAGSRSSQLEGTVRGSSVTATLSRLRNQRVCPRFQRVRARGETQVRPLRARACGTVKPMHVEIVFSRKRARDRSSSVPFVAKYRPTVNPARACVSCSALRDGSVNSMGSPPGANADLRQDEAISQVSARCRTAQDATWPLGVLEAGAHLGLQLDDRMAVSVAR
jgi:hypothetical protein